MSAACHWVNHSLLSLISALLGGTKSPVISQVGSLVGGQLTRLLGLRLQLDRPAVELFHLGFQALQLRLRLVDLDLQLLQVVGTLLLLPLQIALSPVHRRQSNSRPVASTGRRCVPFHTYRPLSMAFKSKRQAVLTLRHWPLATAGRTQRAESQGKWGCSTLVFNPTVPGGRGEKGLALAGSPACSGCCPDPSDGRPRQESRCSALPPWQSPGSCGCPSPCTLVGFRTPILRLPAGCWSSQLHRHLCGCSTKCACMPAMKQQTLCSPYCNPPSNATISAGQQPSERGRLKP